MALKTLKQIEDRYILMVLHYYRGDRVMTADALGICIRTLRNKINEYMRMGYPIPEHHTSVRMRDYYRKKKFLANLRE